MRMKGEAIACGLIFMAARRLQVRARCHQLRCFFLEWTCLKIQSLVLPELSWAALSAGTGHGQLSCSPLAMLHLAICIFGVLTSF